eukprot:gene38650-43802_t
MSLEMTTIDSEVELRNTNRDGQKSYSALPASSDHHNILQFDVTFK